MRRLTLAFLLALCAALVTSPAAFAQYGGESSGTGSTESPTESTGTTTGTESTSAPWVLQGKADGAQEVPGPGDDDASAMATITLDQEKQEICWKLEQVNGLEKVTAGHIHRAPKGDEGDVVVKLFEGDLVESGCVDKAAGEFSDDRIQALWDNPANYYVNIHTEELPKGAIRGQLAKKGELPYTGTSETQLIAGAFATALGLAAIKGARRLGIARAGRHLSGRTGRAYRF